MKNLIVCPLKPEFEAIKSFLQKSGEIHELQVGHIKAVVVGYLNSILVIGGRGKVKFGITCSHILGQYPSIENVICAGSSGALIEGLSTGDLVVGEKTIEHDFIQKFNSEGLPQFLGSPKFLSKVSQFKSNSFNVVCGNIASGDEDITDTIRAKEVHKKTAAKVVAWEGAGGARAAQFFKKDFLEIRAVSDFADSNTKDDFQKHLSKGMSNVAQLIRFLLT